MYLDLLGSSGLLSLGDGCSKELRLDSWLELGGGGVGHLLLLLGWLCCLHRHLLGADLRGTKVTVNTVQIYVYAVFVASVVDRDNDS